MASSNSKSETSQDKGCFATTFERKYYAIEDIFIKRSLRPKEFKTGYRGLYVPRLAKERLVNEAAALRYVSKNTNIPVPKVYCDFQDDEAYYLIMEYVQGVSMSDLKDEQKRIVEEEIKLHLGVLHNLKSQTLGGPSGIIIPPYRVTLKTENDTWVLRESESNEYVFCHNDLSQQNIIVNPDTLKINGIIDWEYAGFWPEYFESHFYTRLGPSAAVGDEIDDTSALLEFLEMRSVCIRWVLMRCSCSLLMPITKDRSDLSQP